MKRRMRNRTYGVVGGDGLYPVTYPILGRQQRFSDTLFDTWGRAKLGADYQFDDRVSASLQAEKNFGQEYRGSTNISCSANYRF